MNPRRLAIALWMTFAFVTWNVVFDRAVADAAVEFSRGQIVRYQHGESLLSIDAAFRPRVRRAALIASAWSVPVVVLGAFAVARSRPRGG